MVWPEGLPAEGGAWIRSTYAAVWKTADSEIMVLSEAGDGNFFAAPQKNPNVRYPDGVPWSAQVKWGVNGFRFIERRPFYDVPNVLVPVACCGWVALQAD
jgi:hypothetical protein